MTANLHKAENRLMSKKAALLVGGMAGLLCDQALKAFGVDLPTYPHAASIVGACATVSVAGKMLNDKRWSKRIGKDFDMAAKREMFYDTQDALKFIRKEVKAYKNARDKTMAQIKFLAHGNDPERIENIKVLADIYYQLHVSARDTGTKRLQQIMNLLAQDNSLEECNRKQSNFHGITEKEENVESEVRNRIEDDINELREILNIA